LGLGDDSSVLSENDGSGTGGTLVKRDDIAHANSTTSRSWFIPTAFAFFHRFA
jgi:hypothetical protein